MLYPAAALMQINGRLADLHALLTKSSLSFLSIDSCDLSFSSMAATISSVSFLHITKSKCLYAILLNAVCHSLRDPVSGFNTSAILTFRNIS